ncbi:MAG: hypothetical protein HRT88_05580, partial [Lentisphaeraceae bacterium]|nr:hypothetical protein [Lentisphaeraceae bacterium]
MISGGSVFGLLFQLNQFLGDFNTGDGGSNKALVVVESPKGESQEFIVTAEQKDADGKNVSRVFPEKGQIKSSEVIVANAKDQLPVSIPSWLERFFAETLDMPLFDKHGNAKNAVMLLTVFGLVLIMLIKAVSIYLNRVFMRWVGARVVTDIRNQLYKKLMKQSMEFHGSVGIGDMMSRCANDTGQVQSAVSNNISSLTRAPMEVISVVGFIIYFSITNDLYSFMAIMFIAMPISILPVILLGKKLKKYASRTLGKISLVMSRMQETLSCMRVVKA